MMKRTITNKTVSKQSPLSLLEFMQQAVKDGWQLNTNQPTKVAHMAFTPSKKKVNKI
jgi:hypothetical protein